MFVSEIPSMFASFIAGIKDVAVAPRATKTIVNPSPKKSAPKNALNLGENLLLSAVSVFKFSKLSPDINDIYPGSSGKMQGDKNVKMPAINDANIDGISRNFCIMQ